MNPVKLAKVRRIAADQTTFQMHDGRALLGVDNPAAFGTAGQSFLGRLKDFLKGYETLYSFLTTFFTSVRLSKPFQQELDRVLGRHGKEAVILNIGSGPSRLCNRDDVINVDLFAFEAVDICIAPGPLPFQSESVDLILSVATLEHVPNPVAMLDEWRRVLKPGGEVLLYVPFMQPFHAAPSDFQRWTEEGCKVLCAGFSPLAFGIGAGPTSGLLWVGCEWLALLCSFGNPTVQTILCLVFMVISSPLKYIDCLVERHASAKNIASAFYMLAQKSG